VIKQICLSTSKSFNVENTIFTLTKKPTPKIINFEEAKVIREKALFSFASCEISTPFSLTSFHNESKKNDIIHYHFPWPFGDILNYASDKNKPKVLTYHSDIIRQQFLLKAYRPLMMSTLMRMDIIVATSPNYVNSSHVLSAPELRDKVRVIPIGVDDRRLLSLHDENIFDKLNIKKNEPYFLFVGVPRYYKGIHTLIKSAGKVDAKIIIAGAGGDEASLKKLSKELNLNNVIFAGMVTDAEKATLIKNCITFILPSHVRSEAFGVVLIEASIFGKPMITCEIGTGTSFVNKHLKTGFVVEPNNPEQLAEAMQDILDHPVQTNSFGLSARQRYEDLFSSKALGNAYNDLYNELL